MRRSALLLTIFFLFCLTIKAQNYTSYFTGNATDANVQAQGGICLMGGASEHDEAMKWFLQQSNGGDILVLRATGSNGYNNYLYSQLGVTVNSVETIVCHNSAASNETYIQDKIKNAEAIWFAGGDQWTYITYWRDTPIDSLINKGLLERNIVIGGTSAGMAIQGGYYFSAQNGTVTSNTALFNPYSSTVTVSNEPFINNPQLSDVITDTHYDNPDRRGRHVTFLGRILNDNQFPAKGIACDEYTAVCIQPNGICKVYGEYPAYDEDVYFIQPNCELLDPTPETCVSNTPLTWNHGGQAVKVYRAKGTMNGSQTFDLNTWNSGSGGTWEDWSVNNGVLNVTSGVAPTCSWMNTTELNSISFSVYPNPTTNSFQLNSSEIITTVELISADGKKLLIEKTNTDEYDVRQIERGFYLLKVSFEGHVLVKRIELI